jgi:hypothetical protein
MLIEQAKDPATMQTAAGFPMMSKINTSFVFSANEVETLRLLAKQVKEISKRDIEREKARLWTLHNDLSPERPMIFADPENGWNEIILASELICTDPLARVWEMFLRKQIYWAQEVKDDKVIEASFDVPYCYSDTGWGVDLHKHGGEEGGSYIVDPAIMDYEFDLPKVVFPEILVDEKASENMLTLANDVFGEILTVRRKNAWWWTLGMTWDYVNLRGLDNLMMDLVLEPRNVHATMKLLSDGYLKRLSWLEQSGYLASNNEGTYVGSGGFGWTNELPKAGDIDGNVTTKHMWGFCESQETVGISPDMFAEFILPYQLPIMEKFGLNCYGCCEPIDVRWQYVKTIPRLRRVSSSPWTNKEAMAQQLGDEYIMSVKPSPTPLAQANMDEDIVRKELADTLSTSKGCILEFIMKDNHTLGGNPNNIRRWVQIAREESERI